MSHPYDFEVLEHTADIGVIARGRNLEEAFAAAAYGLSAVMADVSRAEPRLDRTVEVAAENQNDLLVAWLSELLYLFDAEGFLACRFDMQHIEAERLTAQVWGEPFDPRKHPPNMEVKAITYHQLDIKHKNGYEVRVILDV